jgi:hypothetical protein
MKIKKMKNNNNKTIIIEIEIQAQNQHHHFLNNVFQVWVHLNALKRLFFLFSTN